jgi:hypothetical protein
MTISEYIPAEHEATVAGWWNQRHPHTLFQPAMLPPVGLVGLIDGAPVCAGWLAMTVGVGVACLEMPITKPRTRLKDAKARLIMLFDALSIVALAHDYGVLMVHPRPEVRAFLESYGFAFEPYTYLTGAKLLR